MTNGANNRSVPARFHRFVLVVLALGIVFASGGTTWAQTCMNDQFNDGGRSGNLVCTAKEVFIAEDADGNKVIDASIVNGDGCEFPGDTATVNIVADIHFNADRYDVGIYSALDGGDALRGACAVDILPTSPLPATDLDGDACGDVITGGGGTDLFDFVFQTLTLTCEDQDDDGFLDFPSCFSWRTSGTNDVCNVADDIFPGTKSKCFCERVNLPVPVPRATIKVTKTATPETVSEPGGMVTFDVSVTNESPFANLTLDTLVDSIYGDLNGRGTCSVPQLIPFEDGVPGGADTYSCSFTADVTGDAGDVETDIAMAEGIDENGNLVTGDDDATVTITDVLPSITLAKTANPTAVLEPGAVVSFTVLVTNTSVSSDPVTITSLADDIHGDLNGQGDCSVPQVLAGAGGSYQCSFTALVTGNAGDSETDVVTADGSDDEGNPVMAADSATVDIDDVPSMITTTKTATPDSLPEPGGLVTFSVRVDNTSPVDTVTINSLVDSIYGDLNGVGNCSVPQVLAAGGSYICSFVADVPGDAFTSETDVVTASGIDDDGNPVSDDDDATVVFTDVPPAASADKAAVSAIVTYDVLVANDSLAEDLMLDSLLDDAFGDITQVQGDLVSTTCSVPQTIAIGSSYTCTFDAIVRTSPHTNTVTATVSDNEANEVTPSAEATVTLE